MQTQKKNKSVIGETTEKAWALAHWLRSNANFNSSIQTNKKVIRDPLQTLAVCWMSCHHLETHVAILGNEPIPK